MRMLILVCVLLGLMSADLYAGEIMFPSSTTTGPAIANPISPTLSTLPARVMPSANPPLDIKPLSLPTKIPKSVQSGMIPNLNAFLVQLDRHRSLKAKAASIDSWVHMRAIEPMFADYEEALSCLELSDACLDEAMMNLITGRRESLNLDPAIDLAKCEMDKAEELILFLVELASLDI